MYIELKRSALCEVVRLRGVIRCVATIRGRSARVEPVSNIKYTRAVVCEHSGMFGASGCNVAKPRQTREVWGVKPGRFDMV
jgi:hypothetical protein